MVQIKKRDIIRVLLRSFYIQASWNYERMLGLGFCFCLIPIAKRLFTDKAKLVDFLNRHLDFFNSHPYMATYALGAVANIEQQSIHKRWEDARPITVFKTRVIGPLGAIGDTLFWQLFRPALGIIGVILVYTIGLWGAVLFLIGYNALHLFIRIRGLLKSFDKGFDIVRDLSMRGTQKYFRALRYVFSSLLAIELIIIIARIAETPPRIAGITIFLISAIVSFFLVRQRKMSIELMVILFSITSVFIGMIL